MLTQMQPIEVPGPSVLVRDDDAARSFRADSFEDFVIQHGEGLLRFAIMITGSHADAQDVLQDALVSVYRNWQRIERRDRADAYTRTAIVRRARDLWRSRRHEVLGLIPDRPSDIGEYLVAEGDARLATAVARLPEKQRLVIVLRYYCDLADRDVAAILKCTVGTVKSQAYRGLQKLRTDLQSCEGRVCNA